jgi:cobalt-zinc-cadmium efflux system protein
MGMALGAMSAAARLGTTGPRTFGLYRLEVLAALVNAVLLSGLAIWLLWESIGRIGQPPDVPGLPMLVVGALGLAANLVVLRWTTDVAGESLNVEGARLEVLADTIGSVAVLVAALVVQLTGFVLADTLAGIGIALFVLPRTLHLGRRALRVLLQAAPEGVDPDAVTADLAALVGVARAHDVHVWTLTSGMDVATAHLHLTEPLDSSRSHDLLDRAHDLLRDRHGIDHATIQLEPPSHEACDPHRQWKTQ